MRCVAEPRQTIEAEIVEDEIKRQFSMRGFTEPKFRKVKNGIAFDVPEKDEEYLRTAIDVNVGAFLVGEVSSKEKLTSMASARGRKPQEREMARA